MNEPINLSPTDLLMLKTNLRDIIMHWPDGMDCFCDVCCGKEAQENDDLVTCELCDGHIHQKCYGGDLLEFSGNQDWYCERCRVLIAEQMQRGEESLGEIPKCFFCPDDKGILKCVMTLPNQLNIWVHLGCASHIPSLTFLDASRSILVEKYKPKYVSDLCMICSLAMGVCIKCAKSTCEYTFHFQCAKRHGLIQDQASMLTFAKYIDAQYSQSQTRSHNFRQQEDLFQSARAMLLEPQLDRKLNFSEVEVEIDLESDPQDRHIAFCEDHLQELSVVTYPNDQFLKKFIRQMPVHRQQIEYKQALSLINDSRASLRFNGIEFEKKDLNEKYAIIAQQQKEASKRGSKKAMQPMLSLKQQFNSRNPASPSQQRPYSHTNSPLSNSSCTSLFSCSWSELNEQTHVQQQHHLQQSELSQDQLQQQQHPNMNHYQFQHTSEFQLNRCDQTEILHSSSENWHRLQAMLKNMIPREESTNNSISTQQQTSALAESTKDSDNMQREVVVSQPVFSAPWELLNMKEQKIPEDRLIQEKETQQQQQQQLQQQEQQQPLQQKQVTCIPTEEKERTRSSTRKQQRDQQNQNEIRNATTTTKTTTNTTTTTTTAMEIEVSRAVGTMQDECSFENDLDQQDLHSGSLLDLDEIIRNDLHFQSKLGTEAKYVHCLPAAKVESQTKISKLESTKAAVVAISSAVELVELEVVTEAVKSVVTSVPPAENVIQVPIIEEVKKNEGIVVEMQQETTNTPVTENVSLWSFERATCYISSYIEKNVELLRNFSSSMYILHPAAMEVMNNPRALCIGDWKDEIAKYFVSMECLNPISCQIDLSHCVNEHLIDLFREFDVPCAMPSSSFFSHFRKAFLIKIYDAPTNTLFSPIPS